MEDFQLLFESCGRGIEAGKVSCEMFFWITNSLGDNCVERLI